MKRILFTLALVSTFAASAVLADNGPSPFRIDGTQKASGTIQSLEQMRGALADLGYQIVNEVKNANGQTIGIMIKVSTSTGGSYHFAVGLAPNGDVLMAVPLTGANAAENCSAQRLLTVLKLNGKQDLGYFSVADNNALWFATWVASPRATKENVRQRITDATALLDQHRSTWDLAN